MEWVLLWQTSGRDGRDQVGGMLQGERRDVTVVAKRALSGDKHHRTWTRSKSEGQLSKLDLGTSGDHRYKKQAWFAVAMRSMCLGSGCRADYITRRDRKHGSTATARRLIKRWRADRYRNSILPRRTGFISAQDATSAKHSGLQAYCVLCR